jgi:hypothetical protein
MAENEFIPSRLNGRNDRNTVKPIVEAPTFRELDDDEPLEDEGPGFLRRLGGGVASLLSFALYAGAAAVVLLVIYNVYQRSENAAVVATPEPSSSAVAVAEAAPLSSSAALPPAVPTTVPSSSFEPPASTAPSSQPLRPQLMPGTVVMQPGVQTPSEPVRMVGESAPSDAVPSEASTPVELESASSSGAPVAVAEAPLPTPDRIDQSKVAPIPAVMSPELAAARRAGKFRGIAPDTFTVAPTLAGSDI